MTEPEKRSIFDRCQLKGVIGPDGKPHIEGVCDTKEDRDELALHFEQEAILRVKPAAPVIEPGPEPD